MLRCVSVYRSIKHKIPDVKGTFGANYVEKPNFLMFLYKAFMPISMGVVKGVARQALHDML